MILMTSPSLGMKVKDVCGIFFINSKLHLLQKSLSEIWRSINSKVSDESIIINIEIPIKCQKKFFAAAQVHHSPLDGAKYTNTFCLLFAKIPFML